MHQSLWFHTSLNWQHGKIGAATLEDNARALGWQARDLGHQWSQEVIDPDEIKRLTGGALKFPANDPRGLSFLESVQFPGQPTIYPINLVFEGFGERTCKEVEAQVKRGVRVIIIVTERPTGPTWNGIKSDFMGARMRDRMRWFKRLAPQVEALWCFVPGAAKDLLSVNPNAVDLEIGYSRARELVWDELFERQGYDRVDPLYDFGFFGGLTERRHNIIDAIEKRGYKVHTPSVGMRGMKADKDGKMSASEFTKIAQKDYGSIDVRNQMMVNCKVLIHPAAKSKWGIFSASRGVTCMNLRRPMVSEPTLPTIWENIVKFSPGFQESFIDTCEAVLHNWKPERDRQQEAFKRILAPEHTLGRAIEATILQRKAA